MSVQLNHTIVAARDREASARFLCEMFRLPGPVAAGPFLEVAVDNGVSLDFAQADGEVVSQHYAFLVDDETFDHLHGQLLERDLDFWADPRQSRPSEINTHDGGRGVYFQDPSGHYLEAITVPYGGWPETSGSGQS
jgi:hypothetical protein